jgi:fatty-acyl-CoA synthase
VLLTHPDVAEIAIFGMPDEKWGEVGVAVIVARKDSQVKAEQLLAYLDGRCAKYRWPHHFFFWNSIPKSGYGKIVKKDIKKMLMDQSLIKNFL